MTTPFRAETICPHCGQPISNHHEVPGNPEPGPPMPGRLCICMRCKGMSVFYQGPLGLALRAPTDEEFQAAYSEYKSVLEWLLRGLRS